MIGRIYADRFRIEAPRRPRPHASAWKAWNVDSGEPVELEVLLAEICDLPDAQARFDKAMQRSRTVRHPVVVPILDAGVDEDGGLYLALPLVEAQSLADVIALDGQLPVRRALDIGLHLARGLAALHDAGLVHGGVTAQGIELIDPAEAGDGHPPVRLRDAGLTHLLALAPVPDVRISSIDADLPLLLAAAGGRAARRTGSDPSEDILGLGAALFEAITGRRYLALLEAAGPTPLARDRVIDEALIGVPQACGDLLRGLCAQRRDARIGTAAAAATAIRHTLAAVDDDDSPVPAPTRPTRGTVLGIGSPTSTALTAQAVASARRGRPPSSGQLEPIEVGEVQPVVDAEGDELPPTRPARGRYPTSQGGASAGSPSAELAMVSLDVATVDVGAAVDADRAADEASTRDRHVSHASTQARHAGVQAAPVRPAAAGDLTEVAATTAPPSVSARVAAAAREAAAVVADPDATAAVAAPSRRASAQRRPFSDLPLPPPRAGVQVSHADSPPAGLPLADAALPLSLDDGRGEATSAVAASPLHLGLAAVPLRRASKVEADAPAAPGVAEPQARPGVAFAVRRDAGAAPAAGRGRVRAERDPDDHRASWEQTSHQTDIGVQPGPSSTVIIRATGEHSWRADVASGRATAPGQHDATIAATAPEPAQPTSRYAAAPAALPIDESDVDAPTLSPWMLRNPGPGPEPKAAPAVAAAGEPAEQPAAPAPAAPVAAEVPRGVSFSATGSFLPWNADTALAPPSAVGGDQQAAVEEIAALDRSGGADTADRPAEKVDAFFGSDAREVATPPEAARPSPRWPLWLAAAGVALVAFWSASEAGFLGGPTPLERAQREREQAAAMASARVPPAAHEGASEEAAPGPDDEPGGAAAPTAGTAAPAAAPPTGPEAAPAAVAPDQPAAEGAPPAAEPDNSAPTAAAPAADAVPPAAVAPRQAAALAQAPAAEEPAAAAPAPSEPVQPAAAPAPSEPARPAAAAPAPAEPAKPAAAEPAQPAAAAPAPAEPANPAADEPAEAAAVEPVAPAPQADANDDQVVVAAGSYPIGCHPQLDGCQTDAMPMRTERLRRFALDRHEVRADAYGRCVAQRGCTPASTGEQCNVGKPGRAGYAANCVTRAQAAAFCRWRGSRLPTEAEWEAAARGPTLRRYPWGSQWPSCNFAAVATSLGAGCGTGKPVPVLQPAEDVSWCGAHGLGGGVAEWTASDYGPYPDAEPAAVTAAAGQAVVRGGSFLDALAEVPLVWQRRQRPASAVDAGLGFRCAADLQEVR